MTSVFLASVALHQYIARLRTSSTSASATSPCATSPELSEVVSCHLGLLPPSCPYASHLATALRAAHIAARGDYSTHLSTAGTVDCRSNLSSTEKLNDADFFTDVDVSNQLDVVAVVRADFPTHKIIGEETGAECASESGEDAAGPTWIVDPIDGTTNFACGNPFTCISVAFCEGGEGKVGVVVAPGLGEVYVGVRGYGCWKNGVAISKIGADSDVAVAITPSPSPSPSPLFFDAAARPGELLTDPGTHGPPCLHSSLPLSGLNFVMELGYVRTPVAVAAVTSKVDALVALGCRSVRMLGSGVLDIVFVALGRSDGCFCGVGDGDEWHSWDYAGECMESPGIVWNLRAFALAFDAYTFTNYLTSRSGVSHTWGGRRGYRELEG